MRKSRDGAASAGGASGRGAVATVRPPMTINLAGAALAAVVVFMAVRALGLLGSSSMLKAYLIDANKKAKKPKNPFDVDGALHTLRQGALLNLLIFGVVMLLLVWAMRRPRSASSSRWVLLIVMVFTQLPLYLVPSAGYPSGLPSIVRVAGLLIGLFSVLAVLLVFVPKPSQDYFRACREAVTPPELRGQPRPGLASLFAPKPRGQAAGGVNQRAAQRPATTRAAEAPARQGAPKAKAKVRGDAESVARGAELARSRAKASKSRRTVD